MIWCFLLIPETFAFIILDYWSIDIFWNKPILKQDNIYEVLANHYFSVDMYSDDYITDMES